MTAWTEDWTWFVLDVNPEPWAIGDLAVGRKNGKTYPYVGRNQQLWNYQQAVKEAIGDPDLWLECDMELVFLFWRERASYTTPQARTHRKHEADVTNLAKGTEDALQGVIFKNDRDTKVIHAEIVEQGPDVRGRVVIGIRRKQTTLLDMLPLDVRVQAQELSTINIDNEWAG